ncbi:hypothetical protein RM717_30240 [Streptomyces griseus]|uniref:Integral membrane protein n=1 Tax=Streptomyces stephensoniae TaxID=3375367 RepID=A0ABU2WAC6_9ACTN|nr:hypothetical protein [Streptomyces griseus]MDT0494782.1 hypothetical protein [Streptomyces griseus]
MSTSDQDQDRDQRKSRDRGTESPIAEAAEVTDTADAVDAADAEPGGRTNESDAPGSGAVGGTEGAEGAESAEPTGDTEGAEGVHGSEGSGSGKRLTPRQARRLRIVLSSVGMVAMGVVLALHIASRSSVLVVGVYGLALILCGLVIELSRNGRTRLGSWLLGVGLAAAVGADWLLLP